LVLTLNLTLSLEVGRETEVKELSKKKGAKPH